jgi:hypothetical protein
VVVARGVAVYERHLRRAEGAARVKRGCGGSAGAAAPDCRAPTFSHWMRMLSFVRASRLPSQKNHKI